MTGNATIDVFLADDNLIVREGVRALVAREPDLEVVGMAADYNELKSGVEASVPHVLVLDIRMPPTFQREGIDAAKLIRQRHPEVGVVILSQYDDPEYVVSLLGDGADGYAYLLKDRVAEGDHLARAVRTVAAGGSMLDPAIVDALVRPVTDSGQLTGADEHLLQMVAQGSPLKAIAASQGTTATAATEAVERLFMRLARDASAGVSGSLRRLRLLHEAIVAREEHAERLSRLLPSGVAEKLRREGWDIGASEKVVVTVLMCDIRGYSTIAERADPTELASQLNTHRVEMSNAILREGGTVMQFMGDAVIAVFGAPFPQDDHADRALATARAIHVAQDQVNQDWVEQGLPSFGLGIGLSTGEAAAALLGSEERLEWTLVGDTVNLAQRLQQWASAGEVVISQSTHDALRQPVACEPMAPAAVKGRLAHLVAYRLRP